MITTGDTAIADGVIRLREVTRDDARRLYEWRMDPATRQMFRNTAEVPYETHLAVVDAYFQPANTDRWFVIEAQGGPVGTISLYRLDASGAGEWGRLVIDPAARGRGYARRALRLVIRHALELKVHPLTCEVISTNAAAFHLYRTEGFKEIGRARIGDREFVRMEFSPIHLFVPTFRTDEVLAEIRECLERGWTGLGFKTLEFETAWKRHTGFAHAHFLNSATAGLHLAFKLLKEQGGWRDGDEVITTPLTFVSTNHAILYEHLRPVFADIDDSLCLDPSSVKERITGRTRAVCFVGMGGNPGRYEAVRDLCRERGLSLVLDASHMAGTWIEAPSGPQHAGLDADVAVFSFQAVKNVPTADAGMICFRDARLDEAVRKWTWLGINKDTYTRTISSQRYSWLYEVEHVGFKYHGNSVMAAMGLVGLKYLEQDNAYRRRLAAWYDEQLADARNVTRVAMRERCVPSRHLYQVRVPSRDNVVLELQRHGIYPGVHYRDNTLYGMYAYADGTCPRARRASGELLSLPLHLRLEEHDVRRVAVTLLTSVRERS